jgi:hypothetical protein
MEGIHHLLSLLWEAGYKVSRKKAQICQNTVKYLGFHLSQGQCRLGPERKQAVCSIPAPNTGQQIRQFWGAVGFCQIWIPIYSFLAKSLEKLQREENGNLWYGEESKRKPLNKSRRHSQMPLLSACQM